jgi:hypothetical protein
MIEQKPFVKYKLEEEESNGETFTVRLNQKERELLNKIKQSLDIKSDSKALKECAWIGLNTLNTIFGEKLLKYLFKKERARLSDYQ